MVRIISLVPSSTETLLALGADVVACTRFCEQPDLEHVGGTKNPDLDAIVRLAPDLIVLDREENRLEDHDALAASGLALFVSDVTDVEGALAVVDSLAVAAGVEPAQPAHPGRVTGAPRRTAFVPIWRRPWMTIGADTYGASVLDHLAIDVVPSPGGAYPEVGSGEVTAAAPDLIIVPSEPYVFSDEHVDELAAMAPGADLRRVDGQDLFWWGIRTPGAVSRLAAALVRRQPA